MRDFEQAASVCLRRSCDVARRPLLVNLGGKADVHQFRPTSHFDQKLTSDWQVARLHLQLIQ
jgi:hypothetical protein